MFKQKRLKCVQFKKVRYGETLRIIQSQKSFKYFKLIILRL